MTLVGPLSGFPFKRASQVASGVPDTAVSGCGTAQELVAVGTVVVRGGVGLPELGHSMTTLSGSTVTEVTLMFAGTSELAELADRSASALLSPAFHLSRQPD